MTNELSNVNEQLPEFLQVKEGEERKGVKDTSRYLLPSFFKIVQSQSHELKETHDEGTLIVQPEHFVIVNFNKEKKQSDDVYFTPLLWYPEFTIHNPFGHAEFIRERTLDPDSEIAYKCRSRNPKIRQFECPEQVNDRDNTCKYVEHLNFVITLRSHNEEIGVKPVILTASIGEWKSGANLLSLINARPHDIYGGVFRFTIVKHSGGGNTWYGWNFGNPPEGYSRYISNQEEKIQYAKLNSQLEESLAANVLEVDYENNDESNNEINKEAIDPEKSEY